MSTLEQVIVKAVRVKGNLKLNEGSRKVLRMSYGKKLCHAGKTVFKSKPTTMTDEYSLVFEEVGMHLSKDQSEENVLLEISDVHEFGSLK